MLFGELKRNQLQSVLLLSFCFGAFGFLTQLGALIRCRSKFFAQRVNLRAQILVLGFSLVELESFVDDCLFLLVDDDIFLFFLELRRFLF